jgi:hypothetical protein
MDAEQAYQFACEGFIVVKQAISKAQVAELLGEAKARGPLHTRGTAAVVHWSQAYRELIDNPMISPILEDICGDRTPGWELEDRSLSASRPGFRLDHLNVHVGEGGRPSLVPDGGGLHGGNGWLRDPTGNKLLQSSYFAMMDLDGDGSGGGGSGFANGLTTVAYELEDTVVNNGGFCCIAGSHANAAAVPAHMRLLNEGVHPLVTRVPAEAGDAIIVSTRTRDSIALTHAPLLISDRLSVANARPAYHPPI